MTDGFAEYELGKGLAYNYLLAMLLTRAHPDSEKRHSLHSLLTDLLDDAHAQHRSAVADKAARDIVDQVFDLANLMKPPTQ